MRLLRQLGLPAVIALAIGALLVLVAIPVLSLQLGGQPVANAFEVWILNGVAIVAALVCCWTARRGPERAAWTLIGLAYLAWTTANIYWGVRATRGERLDVPSLADAGWLAFLPLAGVGIVLLSRARLARGSAPWLDGLVASLTAAAVMGSLVLDRVVGAFDDRPSAEVLVYLAYGIGDVVLFGVTAGALVVSGTRGRITWNILAASFGIFLLTDGIYLVESVRNGFMPGTVLSVGWPAAALLAALASCLPRGATSRIAPDHWRPVLIPSACGVVSVGVLLSPLFGERGVIGPVLAGLAVGAVLVRLAVVVHENHALVRASRTEALRDPLTGLGNRRRLHVDFERLAAHGAPLLLVIFDLDGFKEYNDAYGHAAGDAVLAQMGARLIDAVGADGGAYRIGGDEFCVLVGSERREQVLELTDSLVDHPLAASSGSCEIPAEAEDLTGAMEVADGLLYARKQNRGRSVGVQLADIVCRIIAERSPDLAEHGDRVAVLAEATGHRLGLDSTRLATLTTAARLHDIGILGLPDALIHGLGNFAAEERALMAHQTLIGDRILGGTSALATPGLIIRSIREHVDGTGFPDGSAGETIPLEARIIAVCEAFESMIAGRRGRDAMPVPAALRELRSACGSQFDGAVVEAFVDVITGAGDVSDSSPKRSSLSD